MLWIWEVYQDGGEEPDWDIQEDAKMSEVLLRQDVTRHASKAGVDSYCKKTGSSSR